jgi:hypothetical protein
MKTLSLVLLYLFSFSAFTSNSLTPNGDETEIKLPERTMESTHGQEVLEGENKRNRPSIDRHVKESQEETDPIFYDSTTSPAEMEKAD